MASTVKGSAKAYWLLYGKMPREGNWKAGIARWSVGGLWQTDEVLQIVGTFSQPLRASEKHLGFLFPSKSKLRWDPDHHPKILPLALPFGGLFGNSDITHHSIANKRTVWKKF